MSYAEQYGKGAQSKMGTLDRTPPIKFLMKRDEESGDVEKYVNVICKRDQSILIKLNLFYFLGNG